MYRIVLDFDNCILDTERLKEIMAECAIAENERGASVFDRIRQHPGYADFDLHELVFPDALEFIEVYKDRIKILTTSTSNTDENNEQDIADAAEFQALKLQLSGVLDYVSEYQVVPGEKQEALAQEKQNHEQVAFVDDRKTHVESGVRVGVVTFWLRRGGVAGSSPEQISESIEGAKEISSFYELRREIESLELS